MKNLIVATMLCAAGLAWAEGLRTPAPAGAAVYFIAPGDGATVATTFTVKFGLKGMGVAPAGVEMENTGHHHVLIDVAEMPDPNLPLPATEQIVHFGKGQTETVLTLAPGMHTLQLALGNHLHVPHDVGAGLEQDIDRAALERLLQRAASGERNLDHPDPGGRRGDGNLPHPYT
jgi:hypothetical protein